MYLISVRVGPRGAARGGGDCCIADVVYFVSSLHVEYLLHSPTRSVALSCFLLFPMCLFSHAGLRSVGASVLYFVGPFKEMKNE